MAAVAVSVCIGNHALLSDIGQAYVPSWLVFLPVLVVLWGTLNRKPAALTMAASSLVALAVGIGVHGFDVNSAVLSAVSGFSVSMTGEFAAGGPVPALAPVGASAPRRAGRVKADAHIGSEAVVAPVLGEGALDGNGAVYRL